MNNIRVRIAPSPTGIPHIGNTRTVLFNWLFARKNEGQFIVRVEDTDRQRYVPEALDKILEILDFLGLDWDEGPKVGGKFAPYIQSERKDLYAKYAHDLVKKGLAYEDEGAARFKVEKGKNWSWQDLIHGKISFKSDVIEDFVILKSDGFPTYHLAVVIDDHLMEISDVLRGDEWISSTAKHLMLFDALGWTPPSFGHLPVIVGPDKSKLSKRHDAKSILDYRDEGYLKEAIINFMALLGWSPKTDEEIFSLDELVEKFDLKGINTTSPVFNIEKLNWFNKKYIQKIPDEDFISQIKRFSKRAHTINNERLSMILKLIRDRMTTLADFDKYAKIFFEKGSEKSPEKSQPKTGPPLAEKIENARAAIESIDQWTEESITKTLDQWIEANNLQPGDFKNTLRLSVFADNTPPIYESLAVLSKEEVLKRIDDATRKG